MTHSSDQGLSSLLQRLAMQLAQLEARGRRHLHSTLRREALDRALKWALPSMLVVPALWCLSNGNLIAIWPHLSLATLIVPPLVASVVYVVTRARQRVSRNDALAVVEQQLALKDRLTVSAALLVATRRDGFAQAALLEAAPWVEQALSSPLDALPVVRTVDRRRRWLFLPAALLLVALAWWLQMRAFPSRLSLPSTETPTRSASTTPAAVDTPLVSPTQAPAGQRADAADGGRATTREPREDGALTSAATATLGGAAAAATAESAARAPVGGARPSPSAVATTSALGAPGAPLPPSISRSVTLGSEPTPPAALQRAEASTPSGNQDDANNASASADSRSQGQQVAPSQRGSQPPAAEKSPQSSRNGQPQSDSGSKGGQDSQNDGKGSGEGQKSGSRKGSDAGAKAGRGFATLMLARPMRDQVLGQTNPGPVSSVLQQGRSQGGPTTAVQAQDRGRLPDVSAVLPASPQSAQERALLSEYFARDAQAPVTSPVTRDRASNNPKAIR